MSCELEGFGWTGVGTGTAGGDAAAGRLGLVTGKELTLDSRRYDYYDDGFGFCKPQDAPKKQAESLGSVLFGDRLYDSPFEVRTSPPSLARGSTS